MREEESFMSRLAKLFKKIGEALLNLFRGDFPVFLLFLVISFIFWWSTTMSDSYEMSTQVSVNIAGVSDDMRVVSKAVPQINVNLDGKGVALWKSRFSRGRRSVTLDSRQFVKNSGRAAYSTSWLADTLAEMLPAGVSVRSIQPDSIVFRYVKQHKVRVPVVYEGNVESRDQFFLEETEFAPDSISLFVLDSDTSEYRAVARVGDIVLSSDTLSMNVGLDFPKNVLADAYETRVTFISQQYTEKTLEIPVTGVNFPRGVRLMSFPSKAVLVFWVKMSDFDKVNSGDFQVVVDYNDISEGGDERVQLHVFAQPANVRNVRLQTPVVEYLMEMSYQ